jgi:hypothetical protein
MRDLQLPEDLCKAAELKFSGRFETLQELLTFLLREVLSDPASQLDEAEERIVEERLRELGYI